MSDSQVHADAAPPRSAPLASLCGCALVVGLAVLFASLLGVWSRPAGQLAVFWPANALLLGLLVRFPRFDNLAGWLGSVAGFLAAGHLAGDSLQASALLTLGNLASVATGYLLFVRLPPEQRRLATPAAVLHMVWVSTAAAATAGLAGALIGPLLFGADALTSGVGWLVSETVNYIAILPAVLALPALPTPPVARRWRQGQRLRLARLLPASCLLASLVLAVVVGGPGAVAFPVPALLWCGMVYSVFTTSLLTLTSTAWTLNALARGAIDMAVPMDTVQALLSVRVGVCLIALSPIAIASAMAANRSLIARMRHMADHDPLTGIVNRRAFAEHGHRLIEGQRAAGQPISLLLIDIDRFKAVNDNHGHDAGDLVLVQVAQRLRHRLGQAGAVLGRLGGEEFAVLLAGMDANQSLQTAEALRRACADEPMLLDDGRALTVTLSVGVATHPLALWPLEQLLKRADQALYEAKHGGRNCVVPAPLPALV